jgi:hypothetical protein
MGVAFQVLASRASMGVPCASWMPSLTATTQRPWRSYVPSRRPGTAPARTRARAGRSGAGRRRGTSCPARWRRSGSPRAGPSPHPRTRPAGPRCRGWRRQRPGPRNAPRWESPACGRCRPGRCRWSWGCGCSAAGNRPCAPLRLTMRTVSTNRCRRCRRSARSGAPQHLEDLVAVGQVGLVAGAAQRRAGVAGHQFQVVAGLLRQVDEVFVDDAAHTMARAVDARALRGGGALPAPRPPATG